MLETKVEAQISRSITEVYDYLYRLENQTEYNTSIRSALRNPEVPGALPSFTIEIDLALFKLKEVYFIKEEAKNKFFVARCDNSLLSFEDRYEFESVGSETVLRITDRMELKGLLRLSEGLVKINLATQMKENMQRVKKRLEAE
jgi:hypothetical protein